MYDISSHMIIIYIYCVVFIAHVFVQGVPVHNAEVRTNASYISLLAEIEARLDALQRFAIHAHLGTGSHITLTKAGSLKPRLCKGQVGSFKNSTRYVLITEYMFGNTGNQFVELSHGLWLADRLNATLVVPKYMMSSFKAFDLSTLHATFCFVQEHEFEAEKTKDALSIITIELESEESFFFHKIFLGESYKTRYPTYAALPMLSASLIEEMSLHVMRVAACFWANINRNIVRDAAYLVHKRLHSNLNYTAVHKRTMEGGCSKVMNEVTVPSDFDQEQLPMDSPEWRGKLHRAHPVCEYTHDFVTRTINLHYRQTNITAREHTIFAAWDGRGNINDYRSAGNTALSMDHVKNENLDLDPGVVKLVDMFVAIQAELFILNPRSTFSWQIYLVRTILGLKSVPVLKSKDVFCQKQSEYDKVRTTQQTFLKNRSSADTGLTLGGFNGMWVSWVSVVQAMQNFRGSHLNIPTSRRRLSNVEESAVLPFDQPVLPSALPDFTNAPLLVNNRYVNSSLVYDRWPNNKRIPRLFWMAVVDDKEDLPPHIHNLLQRNSHWLPQVCDNQCKDRFMDKYWANTSVHWAYNQLGPIAGAFKADIWRYAVLYTYGGVYIDDDSDIKTPFDEVVHDKDTLIMSEEGPSSLGPCYVSSFHLSDAAFYRRFREVLNNKEYDPHRTFYQGFRDTESDNSSENKYFNEQEKMHIAKRTDFIVAEPVDAVREPLFFHGNTLINWCIFAAPRHPLFQRTLSNVVDVIRSQYLGKSHLHVAKWEPKHKIGLCSTMFIMTYTLREMLVDGSYSSSGTATSNDSEWMPRISVRDFREYGGKCKAIWTGGNPNHYAKKFKTHPHLLRDYASAMSPGVPTLREIVQSLNNQAVMKNEGKDRGIYYISNATYRGAPPIDDESTLNSFTRHPFADVDSMNDYGYVMAEIKHVHHSVIDRLREGVAVLSKEAVRNKLKLN